MMMPQPAGMHQMVPVPYVGIIHGGMATKRRVTISGTIPANASRFSVNLQCGPNTNPRDDIAMHLNFRFDAQVPYVARNHLQMQSWGTEEGHGYLTVNRGQNFEMHIDNDYNHFKIHINGLHFTDFQHRLPIHTVTYLTIDGDVIITGIRFDGQPVSMPMTPQQQPFGYGPVPAPPPPYPGMAPLPPMGTIPPVPGAAPYSVNPVYPGYPTMHGTNKPYHATSSAIPVAVGTGLLAGAAMHGMNKKMMKKEKKMMKKAMKHHKPHKFHHKHFHHGMHGFHHKHSSSSSSSSEEE